MNSSALVTQVPAERETIAEAHLPMNPTTPPTCPWRRLQIELRDHAFAQDLAGNPTTADLACTIAARIDELLTDEADANEVPAQDLD